jgi:transcriptional regulator with XRE-family HTH domain
MNDDFREIGELIKQFLGERKLTQEKFGDMLGGFEQGYISNLVTGRQSPSLEFCRRLEKKFGSAAYPIIRKVVSHQLDEIERALMVEGVPGNVIEKVETRIVATLILTGEHRYGKREKDWTLVAEPPNAKFEKRLPENARKREFINKVLKIFDSGIDWIVVGLESNVEAFLRAMDQKESDLEEGDLK